MPVQRSCGQEVFPRMGLSMWHGGGDWACHQLEHELGGLYDVAHGAGLAAIWQAGRYDVANPERFAQFATNVFDIPCYTDFNKTALAGIQAMKTSGLFTCLPASKNLV